MLNNWKSVVSAAFVVAVLSVGAEAMAGNTWSRSFECYFPGVDYYGCLDWCKGDDLRVKATFNKKTCSVTLSARGQVENCSGRKQCYKNQVEPGCCEAERICIICSTYTVDKKGCAVYCATGKPKFGKSWENNNPV